MKLQFDPNLDFQQEAIASIVEIFEGQELCDTNFTVATSDRKLPYIESDLGIGNKLTLLDEDILKNVQKIQLRNGLKQSKTLTSYDFSVQMETGTGKTYVYLRTIFELNKRYGFKKFVIVVPSIAIKEGVYKNLQITEEHFKTLYDNVPYEYFIYDSQKLGQVRNFATSDHIQIMVINIQAFRKSFTDPSKETKANIIHRQNDRLNGLKPIEFIQETNPIVIIDEPQSVDTTPKAKEAIASLNPLFKLRYSATHKEIYNLMYRLDSVDAYERKLVKQIEVASIDVKDSHNKPYIKLLEVDNKKSGISAKIELDVNKKGKTVREIRRVTQGDDLYEISNGREVYRGYIINDIYCEEGYEYIDFTSKPEIIRLNESIGDVDEDEIKRLQIRKTIEEHLDKELKLNKKGIKVLSLFFIDKVANYRYYDEDGYPHKGKYALMFEEEYKKFIQKPKYHTLFKDIDIETEVEKVHNGYFAIDRKKDANGEYRIKDSEGIYQADESAYNLIMKDKEKLLSFDSKLKFIFSHSALKEGWDNPNVFQICTLTEAQSEMKKRQQIGRGLRIAVNQEGKRQPGFDINTLTIMANESYEDFARSLQKEIEVEEDIKFNIVEKHTFANLTIENEEGEREYLGEKQSEEIWQSLLKNDYIDKDGLIQDKLREDLKEKKVEIPDKFTEVKAEIEKTLSKIAGKLNIKNRDDRREVKLNKAVYLDEDFKNLWNKIKYKTTYSVDFSVDKLIEQCAEEIKLNVRINPTRLIYKKATQEITRGGVLIKETQEDPSVEYTKQDYDLPDIITYLQNETQLTRRTIVRILVESGRLNDFKVNPQKFIDEVLQIIKFKMRSFIVDGIKYEKIGDDEFYSQELFKEEELYGYLSKNMIESKKSVYDHVIYDSEIEKEFALKFEKNKNIKVYTKLPSWFKVDTPLGSYNPDWALLVEKNGEEKLYFVVESKGSVNMQLLREIEQGKIKCGRKHFKALDNDVEYTVADTFERFMENV